MTSKRKTILMALSKAPISTLDDLELATGLERKNLHDNLKGCLKPTALIERVRDDITGQPGYRLTAQGSRWLIINKSTSEQESCDTPAGGGDVSPAADALDHLPEVVVPDEGAAVVEPPPLDDSPAVVGSDVTNDERMEYAYHIAGLENDIKRKAAMIDALQDSLACAHDIIDRHEIENQALATALKTRSTVTAAPQPLETVAHSRWLVADSYIILDTHAEALRAALQGALDSGSTALIAAINNAEQVTLNQVWEKA